MKNPKYDIGQGRIVSRQRIHQLNNPEKLRALQKKYREAHKQEIAAKQKEWRDRFKKAHGMSYYQWRRQNEQTKTK